jgi:hypothetical protein
MNHLVQFEMQRSGVSVLGVLKDEHHQQGRDGDRDVGVLNPMVTRLTTTSTATMAKVQWLPVYFATCVANAVKNRSIPPSLFFTMFE